MTRLIPILCDCKYPGLKIGLLGLALAFACIDGAQASPDSLNVAAPQYDGYANAPIAVLFDRETVTIGEDGRISRRREVLSKALTAKGADSLGRPLIRLDAETDTVIIEAARTRRPDGTWADAGEVLPSREVIPEVVTAPAYSRYQQQPLHIPGVGVGTVTFVAYRIEPRPGTEKVVEPEKGGIVLFGGTMPIREKQFVLDCSAKRPVWYALQNSGDKPVVSEEDGRRRYTWTFHECPQILPEPYSLPVAALVPRLLWTTFPDWESLGTYVSDLFWEKVDSSETAINGYLEVTASQLQGTPAMMNAALWATSGIKTVNLPVSMAGGIPFSGDQVWRNHYGNSLDKTVVLAAILRIYGLSPLPVLVPFENVPSSELPVLEQFGRAILAVPTGDDTVWLDPTADIYPPGELPHACTYGTGCLLVAGAPLLEPIPPKSGPGPTRTELRASLDAIGNLSGFAEAFPQGDQAAQAREKFVSASSSARDAYAKRALRSIGPMATVREFSVSNVADLTTPVSIHIRFDSPGFAQRNGDSLTVDVPANPFDFATCAFDTLPFARYPMDFPTHGKMITEYGFTWPQGFKPVSAPAAVIIENPYLYLELTPRQLPQGFELTETIEIKADRVPVREYAAVRDAFLALASAKNRHFVAMPDQPVKPKAKRGGRMRGHS